MEAREGDGVKDGRLVGEAVAKEVVAEAVAEAVFVAGSWAGTGGVVRAQPINSSARRTDRMLPRER